jgi:hypothetical protein
MSHLKLIILAIVLLLIGAVLPFAMVIRLVEPTLLLNFLAAISQISGLIVGFIGIAYYVRSRGRGTD